MKILPERRNKTKRTSGEQHHKNKTGEENLHPFFPCVWSAAGIVGVQEHGKGACREKGQQSTGNTPDFPVFVEDKVQKNQIRNTDSRKL